MIGYLEGTLLNKDEERILLLVNHVGYEILLPTFIMKSLESRPREETLALYIYFHQTERQPKPVLIGFYLEAEKEFFQQFISVEAIGPIKAAKALSLPIREVARAIEQKDAGLLCKLPGIGNRTALKIIATLAGKMGKFAMIRKEETVSTAGLKDFVQPVLDVLINQLGHKPVDADRLIIQALQRNSGISTPEQLFDEIYRGETAE